MPKHGSPDEWLALRVEGDSMNQIGVQPGCIAIFRRKPSAENGDVVAIAIDDEATIKTYFKDGDHVVLYPQSSNPLHRMQRYNIKKHSIRILGVLDSIVIRFKK